MPVYNTKPNGVPSPFPPPITQSVRGTAAPQLQLLSQDPPAQATYGQEPDQQLEVMETKKAEPAPAVTLTQSWDYFRNGNFDKDVASLQASSHLMTGYKTLDRIQPFYPGFYCLGAIPSLGKTTFASQMADQIATAGQYVLYFSLEQTSFELFSKSLSRGFLRTHRTDTRMNNRPSTYPTPTSMDIRRGLTTGYHAEMARQIEDYVQAVQNRVCVIQGPFSVTVEDIMRTTEEFVVQMDARPIVIVDYLQIVAPSMVNGRIPDTKTSIDHIVHALKTMQANLGLTVLAISSLNRQNYLTPIDYESFKESGGIEYTADVIWGLQLSLLSDRAFYHHYDIAGKQKGETSLKEKREMVNQAKASNPRAIDLICLKNRYGCSSYTVNFEYYPASDYFCAPFCSSNPDTWDHS